MGLLNETVNDLLWKLSYAIRLLLESDKYLIECDQLIIDFCTGLGVLDRAEQTFNLHSLRHLTWQVRNYGPLWTASWFAFQSAHHSLVSTFTGSVNHLRLLVERYLVKKSVLGSNIENDALFDLTSELISGRKKFTHGHLRNTDVVGELCNRAPSVTAREMLHGVVFDSASDTKSSSNSHIMFFSSWFQSALLVKWLLFSMLEDAGFLWLSFTQLKNHLNALVSMMYQVRSISAKLPMK